MGSRVLFCLLFAAIIASVNCNSEGDALNAWKSVLADPNNVLSSWDPTLVNPCTYFHVTCNSDNSVTRLDLGNAGLEGPLVRELAVLTNLQYLEVFENNLTGSIPPEIGHLVHLVSLDLYKNKLSGLIPDTLGHLSSLKYLRVNRNHLSGVIPSTLGNLTSLEIMKLNNNNLTGDLPVNVIALVRFGKLSILDVSNNMLAGTVRRTNSTGFAVTKIIQDPRAQK